MPINYEDYTVGWICVLVVEYEAAIWMLDQRYGGDETPIIDHTIDENLYTFGRIHNHNVVIACLPIGEHGNNAAGPVALHLKRSFPNIKYPILVGVAGGAPSPKHDIRLGDIVVASPTPNFGGVVQYDSGKAIQGREFQHASYLPPAPKAARNALTQLHTEHNMHGHSIRETIADILEKDKKLVPKYSRPKKDELCLPSYIHSESERCDCQRSRKSSKSLNLVQRPKRGKDCTAPVIHYGLIASANTLMKDASRRDALVEKWDVLCFEMEAAALMKAFPCVVIRGICNYSDTHKNNHWQGYAAIAAAAYAKELIAIIPARIIQPMSAIYGYKLTLGQMEDRQAICPLDSEGHLHGNIQRIGKANLSESA